MVEESLYDAYCCCRVEQNPVKVSHLLFAVHLFPSALHASLYFFLASASRRRRCRRSSSALFNAARATDLRSTTALQASFLRNTPWIRLFLGRARIVVEAPHRPREGSQPAPRAVREETTREGKNQEKFIDGKGMLLTRRGEAEKAVFSFGSKLSRGTRDRVNTRSHAKLLTPTLSFIPPTDLTAMLEMGFSAGKAGSAHVLRQLG